MAAPSSVVVVLRRGKGILLIIVVFIISKVMFCFSIRAAAGLGTMIMVVASINKNKLCSQHGSGGCTTNAVKWHYAFYLPLCC